MIYLGIFLLFLKLGGGHCAVTLFQPPAVAAMVDSSTNLSCYMQLNGVKLDRVNLYWLILDSKKKVKEYLYPKLKPESVRSNNSRLVYSKFENDLSLTISNVQLSYTDTYTCETSLLIQGQNTRYTGSGTYLLVYEEFSTFVNHTDLICQVKVQAPRNVDLFWEFQGKAYHHIASSLTPTSNNSYWLISVWTNGIQRCSTQQNQTFTCRLQYMGESLVEQSMEVTCADDQQPLPLAPHPIILYILILANTPLILFSIIILYFCVRKKQRGRRVRIATYAKCSAPSRTKYNG
ncbi:uncharacterized protein [Eleutherodactylus coqui]|uniref:uncharacterized protein n=1 Tax=Eleutherodactylus coqui TaxID=57060 RepID=UPI00346240EF